MNEKLLLQVALAGITYLQERNISMREIGELIEKRGADNEILTIEDLQHLEATSQAAIDSINPTEGQP